MAARYLDSVPILEKKWTIRGYIWRIGPPQTMPLAAIDANECAYIGQMPDGSLLLATQTSQRPDQQTLEKLGMSREACVRPWVVQMYNEENEAAPFAVLDDTGRYYQLESFGVCIAEETPDEATDEPGSGLPVICEFLMGQTSGQLRLCPE